MKRDAIREVAGSVYENIRENIDPEIYDAYGAITSSSFTVCKKFIQIKSGYTDHLVSIRLFSCFNHSAKLFICLADSIPFRFILALRFNYLASSASASSSVSGTLL